MTDKELLELAAKAAGYEIDGTASKYICQGVVFDDLLMRNEKGGHSVWNPLRDDGDAMRLAVKLMFVVEIESWGTDVNTPSGFSTSESAILNPYSATRRAIVRAAAEIGKEMP